jgi:hypothetical protein
VVMEWTPLEICTVNYAKSAREILKLNNLAQRVGIGQSVSSGFSAYLTVAGLLNIILMSIFVERLTYQKMEGNDRTVQHRFQR